MTTSRPPTLRIVRADPGVGEDSSFIEAGSCLGAAGALVMVGS
jgi:hypothetical protein